MPCSVDVPARPALFLSLQENGGGGVDLRERGSFGGDGGLRGVEMEKTAVRCNCI